MSTGNLEEWREPTTHLKTTLVRENLLKPHQSLILLLNSLRAPVYIPSVLSLLDSLEAS